MAITESARNHLFNTLREKLGADDAATMMELLPPTGWADVARRQDLDGLQQVMSAKFESVDERFTRVDERFDEINRRFDELPRVFATKDDLHAQTNRYIGWMVVTNATLVATVGLITSLR